MLQQFYFKKNFNFFNKGKGKTPQHLPYFK